VDKTRLLRQLPAIDKVLKTQEVAQLKQRWLRTVVDAEVRAVVDEARERIQAGEEPSELGASGLARLAAARVAARLAPGTVRCVNATGVVLHTGLGRAVLPPAAVEALQREVSGYTVVSVDRKDGARLRRETTIRKILGALTGAEHATVVNNNAAATVIGLNTMAAGTEAIISRGQLVEIGGSFRMPEVFEAAGVKLREVGATNRTHLNDYRTAINENTGLILRVHPSNYRIIGFTHEPGIDELVALGREHGIPVMDDLGAGALVELPPEPLIGASLEAGVDLVTCSGDKLIGGPQSGILLGKRDWIDRVRRNPLFRALRVDKLTLTALEATLRLFLRPEGPGADHPTIAMLKMDPDEIGRRAKALRTRIRKAIPELAVELRQDFSQVGSGSLPGENLPTTLLTIAHARIAPSRFARVKDTASTPIYTRIVDDLVCVDPRTLQPGDDKLLIHALKEIS